jgi:DNA-binding transcriptional MerR regulator
MDEYSMGDVAKRFGVQNNTVRRWAREYFPDFMSEGAKPTEGGYHKFNYADLTVFATWVRLQSEGRPVEEAKAFLRNGERDVPPDEPMSDEQKNLVMSQVVIQNHQLKEQVTELEGAIENLQDKVKQQEKENAGEVKRGDMWETEYRAAQKRIEELIVELALLKRQLD